VQQQTPFHYVDHVFYQLFCVEGRVLVKAEEEAFILPIGGEEAEEPCKIENRHAQSIGLYEHNHGHHHGILLLDLPVRACVDFSILALEDLSGLSFVERTATIKTLHDELLERFEEVRQRRN